MSEWVNQNWTHVRKQDVVSLLLGLAAVDFAPSNWDNLWPKVAKLVNDELASLTWNENVLLDVVWSVAVLGHLDDSTARVVLNDRFIAQLLGCVLCLIVS